MAELSDAQRELLEDKFILWDRASREGPADMRDYNRRAADALKAALSIASGCNCALLAESKPESPTRAEILATLAGFDDEYMTSEKHHPGHVLIPVEVFERVRALLSGSTPKPPMTMKVDQDWLRRHTETDPDIDVEAGGSTPKPAEGDRTTLVNPIAGDGLGIEGYVYYNPDTGLEWSENHPVESGEVWDAQDVRPATSAERAFYEGWVAEIVKSTPKPAGVEITEEDLARTIYEARPQEVLEPLSGRQRVLSWDEVQERVPRRAAVARVEARAVLAALTAALSGGSDAKAD